MKKINVIAILFLFILASISCAKENVDEIQGLKSGNQPYVFNYAPTTQMAYGNFVVESGIMKFSSQQDLVQTLSALANNAEVDIVNFQNQFDPNLSNEALNVLLDSASWDENQTYINFETNNGFSSLRTIYEQKSTLWGQAGLDERDPNNPANCLPFESLPVLTVLNQNAILGVGTELYKFLNSGLIYVILNGNPSTAALINESHSDGSFVAANVEILNPEAILTKKTNGGCYNQAPIKKAFHPRSSTKKAEENIRLFYASTLFSFVESKLINWEKQGSGYVKKKKTMGAGVTNNGLNDCTAQGNKIISKNNAMKRVKVRTYSDFTLFHSAFSAAEGKLWTNNRLQDG